LPDQRVIGVDVGGTKILAGLVDRGGTLGRRRETPTPLGSQEELLDGLATAVDELLDETVVALGFGVPARLEKRTQRVQGAVNIPLAELDLRARIAERFDLPVGVENDANAAAYAEFHAGAGREADTMVMLTLGTGCGGGVVLDGSLYRGWAEFGHMVVVADGAVCPCGGRGHLEAYASGRAASALARDAFGPAADAHRLVRLADEGDARAREILEQIGGKLGAGVASLANVFGADLCVIGGGFGMAAFEWLLPPAEEVARRDTLSPVKERLRIVRAELGTAAGVIGAGLVALHA
jgi:glucokinase